MFDVSQIKTQFPIFQQETREGRPLVYLDNASTTQKPEVVLNAIDQFYRSSNANIHRGIYYLGYKASEAYANARKTVQEFIGAAHADEIVFVRGTTEGINLVAQAYLATRLEKGDNVVVTIMEHHANFVPWQQLCQSFGAELRVIPLLENLDLDLDAASDMIDHQTKLVCVVDVSNTLGIRNDIVQIKKLVDEVGTKLLVDAAQSVSGYPIDMQAMDCDFFCFSGHKIFGPTGIGVLYGKRELLSDMSPYQFGGDMISEVSIGKTTFKKAPQKFEAGTPNIAGAIGLAAAIDFVKSVGFIEIRKHLDNLGELLYHKLAEFPKVRLIAEQPGGRSICSFTIAGVHPHDIATVLDQQNIAIRAGHHCTEPLLHFLELPATARVSLSIYNNEEDIDRLIAGIDLVHQTFGL